MAELHILRFALVIALLSGVSNGQAADSMADGAALLQPFKQNLKQALMTGLAQGPEKAIDACRIEAPAIAAALAVDGVTLGRTSHRLRNPDNAGPEWALAVLRDYLAGAKRQPRTVTLDDGRQGYVEAIDTKPLCLNCHGTTLSGDVAATLERLYPTDQAVGFETGDLRGVFWVAWPTR